MKKKGTRGSADVWPLESDAPKSRVRETAAPHVIEAPPAGAQAAKLTHFNEVGDAHMVDVGAKPETAREAIASGVVTMELSTAQTIDTGRVGKGDVLAVARLAGIQAAKRASDLIPLCHPLRLTAIEVDLRVDGGAVYIRAQVRAFDRSGVEMEALAAVSAAALTVYDMCKAIDRGMVISDVRLEEKRGGKSGTWTRESLRSQVRSKPRKSAKNR